MHSLRSRSGQQRPRSCTTPWSSRVCGVTLNSSHQPIPEGPGTAKVRKRSYSAVLPRSVPDEALMQLLSISRHSALSPHAQHIEQHHDNIEHSTTPHPSTTHVTTQAEFMKIELKGLRKNVSRSGDKLIKSPRHGTQPHEDHRKSHDSKLPSIPDPPVDSIPDPPVERERTNTKLRIIVTKATPRKQEQNAPAQTELSVNPEGIFKPNTPLSPSTRGAMATSPSHINPGESKGTWPSSVPRTKQHFGASGRGRLSQGWASPQPIEPLKGSPIYTSPRRVGGASLTREGAEVNGARGVSPTPSMAINLNVNDFLTE